MFTRKSNPTSLAVGLFLIASSLPAQLSGAYTIDPAGSGSRNFKTFNQASYQLFLKGVSGATVFSIAPGTYTDRWILFGVAGASSTYTITFRSATKGAAKRDVAAGGQWEIYGLSNLPAKWFILDGIGFSGSSGRSSAYGAIDVRGEDIEIRNCEFIDCMARCQGARFDIHHSLWRGTKRTYLAWFDAAGGAVHHNEFRLDIDGNSGLSVSRKSSSRIRTRVYNNLIWGFTQRSAVFVFGGVDFVHNTVVILPEVAGPRRSQSVIELSPRFAIMPVVTDNVLVNLNGGWLMRINSSPYSSLYARIHNNLYWATRSTNLFYLQSTSSQYSTLSAWQFATKQDANSLYGDPKFQNVKGSPADLRLKPGSPATGTSSGVPAYVTTDFAGRRRLKPGTIGAYEGTPVSTFVPFGKGCAGTFGNVPVIGYSGDLRMGSSTFAVTLSNALGGTGVKAFFTIGVTKATINFGGACNLLLSPALLLSTTVGGTSGPGNGRASAMITLPSDPKLRGMHAHFQWGVVDSAASGIGVAFSNAATLTL